VGGKGVVLKDAVSQGPSGIGDEEINRIKVRGFPRKAKNGV
jgi:hypothetical protein